MVFSRSGTSFITKRWAASSFSEGLPSRMLDVYGVCKRTVWCTPCFPQYPLHHHQEVLHILLSIGWETGVLTVWSTSQQPSMQSSHHYSSEHTIHMHVNENNSQLSSAHEPLLQALQNWSRCTVIISTVRHGGSRWKRIAGFFSHVHYGKQTDANLGIISVDSSCKVVLCVFTHVESVNQTI